MPEIVAAYGRDIERTTLNALDASGLSKMLRKGMQVALKPNMVLAKHPSLGATTHLEIIEAVIRFLQDFGIQNIKIIESSWTGESTEKAYQVCGYHRLPKKYGVTLIDLKKDTTVNVDTEDLTLQVCRQAVETDFLINIPVLKAHCQTNLTCNMKNLKGCIPDSEKRRYHTLGLHKPIAYLNKAIYTHFCVVDGICGDLTFEEGGNPVERNMVLAGDNALLLDSYCAGLIGYEPEDIPYLIEGQRLRLGPLYVPGETNITTLGLENKPEVTVSASPLIKELRRYVDEQNACSACFCSLMFALHRLDPTKLRNLPDKIKIGQNYKGKLETGIGIGNCTKNCQTYIRGCPPRSADIYHFLQTIG